MRFRAFVNQCRTKPLILMMLGLCSCGFGLHSLPSSNLGSSAAVLYSINSADHRLLRYTTNDVGTATLDSSINLPSGLTATLVATDTEGDIYIGGYTTNVDRSEVLVYDSQASDDDTPLHTVALEPGKLTALTVDRQNLIYAALQKDATTIHVYSSEADGIPIRSIDPSFVDLNDMAVDAEGNLYVSGWDGRASIIREFETTASGKAAAFRSIVAPRGSDFAGLTVDDDENIYVMQDHTICEFAEDATGTPRPKQAINLPARFMAYADETSSNVLRRDGLGDFFVPVTMTGANGTVNMVYGFAGNAEGDATPILQFTVPDATATGPHGHNIPLAIF